MNKFVKLCIGIRNSDSHLSKLAFVEIVPESRGTLKDARSLNKAKGASNGSGGARADPALLFTADAYKGRVAEAAGFSHGGANTLQEAGGLGLHPMDWIKDTIQGVQRAG